MWVSFCSKICTISLGKVISRSFDEEKKFSKHFQTRDPEPKTTQLRSNLSVIVSRTTPGGVCDGHTIILSLFGSLSWVSEQSETDSSGVSFRHQQTYIQTSGLFRRQWKQHGVKVTGVRPLFLNHLWSVGLSMTIDWRGRKVRDEGENGWMNGFHSSSVVDNT